MVHNEQTIEKDNRKNSEPVSDQEQMPDSEPMPDQNLAQTGTQTLQPASPGRILWGFLAQYRFTAIMFMLFGVIFMGVFSLYDLETEAVIYAALLCLLTACLILGARFRAYYKKHRRLEQIRQNIEVIQEELPPPANLMERDLEEIIADLWHVNQRDRNAWLAQRQDSIDYYTAWVHQIKAPIAVMKLILQGQDTEENKELLSELFRIEQYTEMVLCYFRLDSASSDFVIRSCDLDGIIRQAIRKFAPQFVRKRIRLVYDPTQVQVLTDEKWLLFIVEQILSNALKYTETGAITIRVDEQKVLYITDTGIGIAPEDLPRIFEKGFTGYNGRADKKSTGLGLYLCKKTADKLSHRLSAVSEAGRGTTIQVDLHAETLEIE
ncbi:sensor histidine kinase [Hespellia stercorisuis]|uniref:histidine kinase n=1 Tax=Hespellia stercorisuis DSM 15480 TaxID=1121950 RepID=A0A1M6MTZ0_9FIRM|nr:sensor histidine kinase [Hespellia stercorisuis]SHJ86866.1 hypothetical protein SAMN02745243_01590 [Hespellia stercorisuis DSM 15480]